MSDILNNPLYRETVKALKRDRSGKLENQAMLERQLRALAAIEGLSPQKAAKQVVSRRQKLGQDLLPDWGVPMALAIAISVIISIVVIGIGGYFVIRGLKFASPAGVTPATQQLPSSPRLRIDPPHPDLFELPADGKAQTRILITVKDESGNLAPNNTSVAFVLSNPALGQLDPPIAVTQNGEVVTTFIAGTTPGPVEITVRVGQEEKMLTLQLSQAPKPQPAIELKVESARTVEGGGKLEFIFTISNLGQAEATNCRLVSGIPADTQFIAASDQGQPSDNNRVLWPLEKISPGTPLHRTLTVAVSSGLGAVDQISYADYVLYCGGSTVPIQGNPVNVRVIEAAPARLELIARPNTLPADGQTLSSIEIKVFNQQEQPFPGDVNVNFTVQPPRAGVITPQVTVKGSRVVTFTASTSGTVSIIATAGQISGLVSITATAEQGSSTALAGSETPAAQSKQPQLKEWSHLYAVTDTNKMIIYQLPSDTPIELIGEPQGDFRQVALTIWASQEIITLTEVITSTEIQQGVIKDGIQDTKVKVDDPENKGLNSVGAKTTILATAAGWPVEILGRNDANEIKVRIKGWMFQKNIKGE